MNIFEKKFQEVKASIEGRGENFKKAIAKGVGMSLITLATFLPAESANAQDRSQEILDAIKSFENKMEHFSGGEKVKSDKPSFVLAGESELMDAYHKFDKNAHDSIYKDTKGVDDFAAQEARTVLLESSPTEDFYLISSPTDMKAAMQQNTAEASARPVGAEYYVVFSKDAAEYKATIFDTKKSVVVDTVSVPDSADKKFEDQLAALSEEVSKKVVNLQ